MIFRIISTVVLLLFVLILGLFIYQTMDQNKLTPNRFNYNLIAFDYDGIHNNVTPDRLRDGDAVIFFKILPNHQAYLFNSLEELKPYDPDMKGYIAMDNPNFKRFYIGRYLKNKNVIEYQQGQNSGIAGIELHYSEDHIQSASVILLDNAHRNLSTVLVNDGFLDNATLQASSGLGISS